MLESMPLGLPGVLGLCGRFQLDLCGPNFEMCVIGSKFSHTRQTELRDNRALFVAVPCISRVCARVRVRVRACVYS